MSGAEVGGRLYCVGGSFGNEGGTALNADDAKISGDVILGGGFSARGVVRLYDATVGNLVCAGGQFKNPGGFALVADRVTVRGMVRLDTVDGGTAFTAEGGVWLVAAQIGGQLSCAGGSFSNEGHPALIAAGAKVSGDVILGNGFSARGVVSLYDTSVVNLVCTGGVFRNPGSVALVADRISVRGNAWLDRLDANTTFTAEGVVRFAAAHVGGQLTCTGGSFSNRGGAALVAEGVMVGGDAFLDGGFSARGQVSLYDASVDNLFCSGGRFKNPGGIALGADRISVRGDVRLDRLDSGPAFSARGEVRFTNAQVGGQLTCTGGSFSNKGGAALVAEGASVSGDVRLSGGFSARGLVSLYDASAGNLLCTGATFSNPGSIALGADRITIRRDVSLGRLNGGRSFTAEGAVRFEAAQVGGEFHWCPGTEGIPGPIDLRSASVGTLSDDPGGRATPVVLDGLSYKALHPGPAEVTVTDRIAWLQRNPAGYTPETYVKLAALYRADGHDDLARKVLVANQKRRPRSGIGRAWGWLLWITVGYGYYPWLALAWLVGLLAAGTLTFELLPRPLFVATTGAPPFQPFLYTVNVLVPFVNTQQDKWVAHGAAQWISFVLVVLGWILATSVISAFTGVLRRGD
jgi:hypothetical protein